MTNDQRFRILGWLMLFAERLEEEADPAVSELEELTLAVWDEMEAIYRAAGEPLGSGGAAMLSWFERGSDIRSN